MEGRGCRGGFWRLPLSFFSFACHWGKSTKCWFSLKLMMVAGGGVSDADCSYCIFVMVLSCGGGAVLLRLSSHHRHHSPLRR